MDCVSQYNIIYLWLSSFEYLNQREESDGVFVFY